MNFSRSKIFIGLIFFPLGLLFAQTDIQLRDPEYLIEQYNQLVAKHNALIEKTRIILTEKKNSPVVRSDQEDKLKQQLNDAIAKFLESNKSPSRKVNEIDNRGSHFYLAMYWAEAMAYQDEDPSLKEKFGKLFNTLGENETTINQEMLAAQGEPVDVGGYYRPDAAMAAEAMRPSQTFNAALEALMQ